MDGVWSGKPFDFAAIADSQFGLVEVADLGEFVGHPFVRRHAVEVTTFHHEGAGSDQGCHFGVIEGATQIEFKYFVFTGPDITVRSQGGSILPHPIVEIGRADGQAIIGDQSGTRMAVFPP